MKYYTIYLAKTDEIIAFGRTKECAMQLRKDVNNVRSMICRVLKGANKKYEIYIEDI